MVLFYVFCQYLRLESECRIQFLKKGLTDSKLSYFFYSVLHLQNLSFRGDFFLFELNSNNGISLIILVPFQYSLKHLFLFLDTGCLTLGREMAIISEQWLCESALCFQALYVQRQVSFYYRLIIILILLLLNKMFALDFKPKFYSYPLHTEQYARIKLSNQQIQVQINKLQAELRYLNSLHNSSNYQPYKARIEDKVKIFQQQLRQYAQVLECHEHIDACLKNNRRNNSEVKHKLLEQYKAESIAKKYKRASIKFMEAQKQRQLLRNNQSAILAEVFRIKAKKQMEKAYIDVNPENYSYGKKYNPRTSDLLYSSNRRQQPQNSSNPQFFDGSAKKTNFKLPKLAYSNFTKAQTSDTSKTLKEEKDNKLLQSFVMSKI